MTNLSKSDRDNRANQLNPICVHYYLSRGISPEEAQERAIEFRRTLLKPSESQPRPRTRKPA